MKINIWIRKQEAISGNITKYYNMAPQSTDWPNYVEVSVSQDEFAKLEDNGYDDSDSLTWSELDEMSMKADSEIFKGEDWLVDQYNRNRNPEDWVETREEIPYIFEKNPDSGKIYRRKIGDNHENRERVSMGVAERDYTGERGLDQLLDEMEGITGKDFLNWFHKLTKNEQTKLTTYYND